MSPNRCKLPRYAPLQGCCVVPDPGVVQEGGCGWPLVRVLLQADPHKVLPLWRVALREVDLVAVHDQRRSLHLHSIHQPSEQQKYASQTSRAFSEVLWLTV